MRPAASYRAARRNAYRGTGKWGAKTLLTGMLRYWRDGPWYTIKHKVRREVVIMDRNNMPVMVMDPKTRKKVVKTEWRMIERLQVIHGSIRQALQPA